MKINKLILLGCFITFLCIQQSQAQFLKKLAEKVEKTVEETVIRKIDEKAARKTEQTMDTLLNTKSKSKAKKRKKGNKKEEPSITVSEKHSGHQPSAPPPKEKMFKAYSKFDFIPGEEIIAFEDFSQDEVGDLPAQWNSTNSVEVVTLEGIDGKWAKLVEGNGAFVPDFITEFPDNFTFEYDLIYDFDVSDYTFRRDLNIIFSDIENPSYDLNNDFPGNNGFIFTISGGISYGGILKYQKYTGDRMLNTKAEKENELLKKNNLGRGEVIHIAIWRQKQRMRVYFNEEKVFDIPRAFEKGVQINSARFLSKITEPNTYYFINNVRYAVGKPDVRSKLITEGRLVTYGITFNVNSAEIKAASYGTLKNIANILKQHPDVKVTIVGHTDADGSEESNLSLSQRRAESVKNALVDEFSVNAQQLTTQGKGESELIDLGSSPESKAKNRRVEFIKQ